MRVTLFLPVKNEVEGLKLILPRIRHEWVDEILAVDGNSNDGSYEYLLSQPGIRVLKQTSDGICGAYWDCVENCQGDAIIAFSPDNNSIPELIPQVVDSLKKGADMVVASRYFGGARSEDDDVVTAFGNWMFTKMTQVFFKSRSTDSLVMFRGFRKSLVQELELDERVLPVFEMQLTIRCAKAKKIVVDIPGDEPKRYGSVRKMSPLYNGSSVLYLIIKELFRWRPKSG